MPRNTRSANRSKSSNKENEPDSPNSATANTTSTPYKDVLLRPNTSTVTEDEKQAQYTARTDSKMDSMNETMEKNHATVLAALSKITEHMDSACSRMDSIDKNYQIQSEALSETNNQVRILKEGHSSLKSDLQQLRIQQDLTRTEIADEVETIKSSSTYANHPHISSLTAKVAAMEEIQETMDVRIDTLKNECVKVKNEFDYQLNDMKLDCGTIKRETDEETEDLYQQVKSVLY